MLTGSVLDPSAGELYPSFFSDAADVIARSIVNSARRVVEGQVHVIAPEVLAPILAEFFNAGSG